MGKTATVNVGDLLQRVSSPEAADQVEWLWKMIQERNVCLVVKGRAVSELPLAYGLLIALYGVLHKPRWAALGALAMWLSDIKIEIVQSVDASKH